MKLIMGFRPKAYKGGKKQEFVLFNPKTKIGNKDIVKSKIIQAIKKDPEDVLEFVILEGKDSYIRSSEDLAGEVINIIDETALVEFEQVGNRVRMNLSEGNKKSIKEAAMRQHSIDQMKMVHKIMGNQDIGDRVAKDDSESNMSNLNYIRDPYENMESYEDAMSKNKHFITNWNVNQISLDPFKHNKPHGSHSPKEDPSRYDMHKITHLKESILKFNEFEVNEGLKTNILTGILSLFSHASSAQNTSSIDKIKTEIIKKNYLENSFTLDKDSIQKIYTKIKNEFGGIYIDTIEVSGSSEKEISSILDFIKPNFLLLKVDVGNTSVSNFLTSNGVNKTLLNENNISDSSIFYLIRVKTKNEMNPVRSEVKYSNPLALYKMPQDKFENLTEINVNVKPFNVSIDLSSQLWTLLFTGAFDVDGISIK